MTARLAAELATALSSAEEAIGGCARTHHDGHSTVGGPTPGAVLALWRLLVHVTGETAPPARVVAMWRARERADVRAWGERELARKVVGADGCPAVAVPSALAAYWRVR